MSSAAFPEASGLGAICHFWGWDRDWAVECFLSSYSFWSLVLVLFLKPQITGTTTFDRSICILGAAPTAGRVSVRVPTTREGEWWVTGILQFQEPLIMGSHWFLAPPGVWAAWIPGDSIHGPQFLGPLFIDTITDPGTSGVSKHYFCFPSSTSYRRYSLPTFRCIDISISQAFWCAVNRVLFWSMDALLSVLRRDKGNNLLCPDPDITSS